MFAVALFILDAIFLYAVLIGGNRKEMPEVKNKTGVKDVFGAEIYEKSTVKYRNHLWEVRWDIESLSYYLDPYESILQRVPFTSYTARECEVIN